MSDEDRIAAFQQRFGRHIPRVRASLATARQALFELEEWFYWEEYRPLLVRSEDAYDDLAELMAFLRTRRYAPYLDNMGSRLFSHGLPEPLMILEQHVRGLVGHLDHLEAVGARVATLDRFAARAKANIRGMTDAGRTNWQAVQAVRALRALWEEYTGKPAPRAIRDDGAFPDYIRDGFDWLGVEASPRAAFAAWRRVER